jgi:predicted NAD/FAD-binding protein
MPRDSFRQDRIAIVGTGISGLSAAWLLAPDNDITVYEEADRTGGHSNTVSLDFNGREVSVDTGFIVFNEVTYPNLTALFDHLKVATHATNMSFAASLRGGDFEYSGESIPGLFAQKTNLVRGRFWAMLYDLQRFYRHAPGDARAPLYRGQTLGEYLLVKKYSDAFVNDHLLPLSAAIWSAAPGDMLDYPLEAFVQFHDNHGLLNFVGRPVWRTVRGGSRVYVDKLTKRFADRIRTCSGVVSINRRADGVEIVDRTGKVELFDHVVIASHADQALAMLGDPSPEERRLLSAFRYSRNEAYLHSDTALMPRRKKVWASWNFIESEPGEDRLVVSYWMNKLQDVGACADLFVTLNPVQLPREDLCHRVETYEHPVIDRAAIDAQKQLWSLQGVNRTWFCGAWFGAGFHEDGLQSGLAVAEQLGGVRRPWTVANESGRIHSQPAVATKQVASVLA